MNNPSRWLDVEVATGDIQINALPSSVALVNLHNDEDYKLLICDMGFENEMPNGSKLKIFKGTSLMSELVLPDVPVAVVGFYTNETLPRSHPVIAIAMGSSVFIYKNMKLFFKYFLPSSELLAIERDIWKQMRHEQITQEQIDSMIEPLKSIPAQALSLKSQRLLSVNPEDYIDFVKQFADDPFQNTPEITCLATLNINSIEPYAVSCLIIATENRDVLFLDPQTFTQLRHAKIPGSHMTPWLMVARGLYDVDYRIIIATREKSIWLLKRDWLEAKCLVHTESYIVAMEVIPSDNTIIAICMDSTMQCFSRKGRKQWVVNFEHYPVTMTLMSMSHLGTVMVAVALKSGHLYIYNGKTQVDSIFVKDVVSVMKFGQLGQEEHVLVIITLSGSLILKILKRTAEFDLNSPSIDVVSSQLTAGGQQIKPLVVPKKSKLFMEQSSRERDNAVAIHNQFQEGLLHLRLTAARAIVEAHQKADNSIGVGSLEFLHLSAEVEGLGPTFRVILCIENTSATEAVTCLSVLFVADIEVYKVSRPYFGLPTLTPNLKIRYPTTIEELFPSPGTIDAEIYLRTLAGAESERSLLKVLLLRETETRPVLAASVRLPPTDPMMLPVELLQSGSGFV